MEIKDFKYECIYLLVLAVLGLPAMGFSLVAAGGDDSLRQCLLCCGGRSFWRFSSYVLET